LRVRREIPSLRERRAFSAIRNAIVLASNGAFRVIHFSVQRDHIHIIVEADHTEALSRGLSGLLIRVARALNRALGRRGPVWGDRYHARALRTPAETRFGILYVLQNWKKHLRDVRGASAAAVL
jgi:putative transposase